MKSKILLIIFLISVPFIAFSQEIKGSFSKQIKSKIELNYIVQLPEKQKE